MLSAGDLIDNSLGVKFGLATLTAAACGQVVRNMMTKYLNSGPPTPHVFVLCTVLLANLWW